MIKYKIKNWNIEVINDETYTSDSKNNKYFYDEEYGLDNSRKPSSKHGVFVKNRKEIVSSAVLLGYGGATSIHDSSVAIDENKILICVSDTIFCLSIPSLNLEWNVKADDATCFEIYSRNEGYFVHGELSISKLNKMGQKEWEYSGRDIFVSPEGRNEFALTNDHIVVHDWQGHHYKLDLNGNEIKNV